MDPEEVRKFEEDLLAIPDSLVGKSAVIPTMEMKKPELIEMYFYKCKEVEFIDPPMTRNKLMKTRKTDIIDLINDLGPIEEEEDDIYIEMDTPEPPIDGEESTLEIPHRKIKPTKKLKMDTGAMAFKLNVFLAECVEAAATYADPDHAIVDLRGLAHDFELTENKKVFTELYSEIADDYPVFCKRALHWSGRAIVYNADMIRQVNKYNKKKVEETMDLLSPPD